MYICLLIIIMPSCWHSFLKHLMHFGNVWNLLSIVGEKGYSWWLFRQQSSNWQLRHFSEWPTHFLSNLVKKVIAGDCFDSNWQLWHFSELPTHFLSNLVKSLRILHIPILVDIHPILTTFCLVDPSLVSLAWECFWVEQSTKWKYKSELKKYCIIRQHFTGNKTCWQNTIQTDGS